MVTQEILTSHPVTVLKKEISKTNVKGYSKMKKAEVINLMLKHKERFSHIKMAEMKEKKSPVKKDKTTKKSKKEDTHEMPDGTKMTGKTHTKDSKPVKKPKKLNVKKLTKNILSKDSKPVKKGLDKKGLVQKYTKLIDKESDKKKKKDLSIEMNKKIAELKKK